MKTGRVTGADVAKAAGVSRATVSYVMNDTAGQTIPEETRKRVLGAAAELGYVPLMAGRTLRRGRSDLIVWLLPDWPIGSEVGRLIEALSREASQRKYTLAIVREGQTGAQLESTVRTLAPAAIVAMHAIDDAIIRYARSAGVPVASAVHTVDGNVENDSGLAASARAVGYQQAAYLADRGHTNIAYLYPDDPRVRLFAENRLTGARRALKDRGAPALRKRIAPLDRTKLAAVAKEWHDAGVTAVCAYNDEWAMGMLSGMHSIGLAAPHHLAVIGCDDIICAAVASPPLTTISQDMDSFANLLMERVEVALGVKDGPVPELVESARVVQRESA